MASVSYDISNGLDDCNENGDNLGVVFVAN